MANHRVVARKAFNVWWKQWRKRTGAPAGDETTEARAAAFEAWMHQRGAVADECAAEVPTNWCDPLLTGPDAALKGEAGKWGCREIEALLRGVQDRIRARKP